MELGGVSINRFENILNEKIKTYEGNWDINRNGPKNNRGIENPYTRGNGIVINLFYEKEQAIKRFKDSKMVEDELDRVSKILTDLKEKVSRLTLSIDSYNNILPDILKRQNLDIEIKNSNLELKKLKDIKNEWEKLEKSITDIDGNLDKDNKEYKKLLEELEKLKLVEKKENISKLLEEISLIDSEIDRESKKIASIKVTKEDLERLKFIESEIEKLSLRINSTKFKLNILKDSKDLKLKDIEDKEIIKKQSILTSGYLKIITKDADLEIVAENIDPKQIKEDLCKFKTLRKECLEKFAAENLSHLEKILSNKKEISDNINNLKFKRETFLQGRDKKELEESLIKLKDLKSSFKEDDLRAKTNILEENIKRAKIDLGIKKNRIENLISIYSDKDNLFDLIVNESAKVKTFEKELASLKKLPSDFKSTGEFIERLDILSKEKDASIKEKNQFEIDYNNLSRRLSGESSEEIQKDIKEKEDDFRSSLEILDKLYLIKNKFYQTLDEMREDPLSKHREVFKSYLNEIDENLKISSDGERIITKGYELDYDLLSKGTKDSVSLAFRLSLIKTMLEDEALIFLDDSINDLDDSRRLEAIKLFKKFANNSQLIFFTASSEIKGLFEEEFNDEI